MKAPVSVVIPCYCAGATIERAMQSVARQTLAPAECILVDDASPDGSLADLQALAKQYGDDWIKIISLPNNVGPGEARNHGIQAAAQPYIALLDADDTWHPEKLAVQFAYIQQYPEVDLWGHQRVDGRGIMADNHAKVSLPSEHSSPYHVTRLNILMRGLLSTSTLCFRKKGFLPFPPDYYCEDYSFILNNFFHGKKYALISAALAYRYKSDFGESGLSDALWKMEKAQLHIYHQAWGNRHISTLEYCLLIPYSYIKYIRRLLLTYIFFAPEH